MEDTFFQDEESPLPNIVIQAEAHKKTNVRSEVSTVISLSLIHILNVTMSKEGVAVTVDPESDKVITEKGEGETEDAQTCLLYTSRCV